MTRWTLQTEPSKACLLPNTLKCGESWWGAEGRKGKVFCLCFFVYTFPRCLRSWGFSFLLYWCPKQKKNALLLSLWSPGSTTGLSVWFMLNIQTNYQKENGCVVFSLHWILAVCNVYWISKTLYLTFFFFFYNTSDSRMVLKKRYFASSPAFLTFILKYIFLPTTPAFQWHAAWCGRCIGPHFCKLLYTWIEGKLFHLHHKGEIKFPK